MRQWEKNNRYSESKGWVGKTTTAINLSSALGFAGANVLVVDMDHRGMQQVDSVCHYPMIMRLFMMYSSEGQMSKTLSDQPKSKILISFPDI